MMKKANKNNLISKETTVSTETINFLRKRNPPRIDLLVTSPPYVTSYEYADLHQMSLLWLGFTDDYKDFRNGTIGSMHHKSDFETNQEQLNTTGSTIVGELAQVDANRAKNTAQYFVDMQKVIKKSHALLNTGGYALFVIGNTEYKNVCINNAKHLVESMLEIGFKEMKVSKRSISNKILTPYRDKSGKFTRDKNSRRIYAEEFIVVGRKQ